MSKRRGGDIQVANMMLRRLHKKQDNENEVCNTLQTLFRVSKTTADYLRESKSLVILIRSLELNRSRPRVLKLLMKVLDNALRCTDTAENASQSAWEMSKDGLVEELMIVLEDETLIRDVNLVRSTITLIALTFDYWASASSLNVESFKSWCFEQGILRLIVGTMLKNMDDVNVCDAGVYVIYWFQCATDENVQRSMWGSNLNLAIEAALYDCKVKVNRKRADDLSLLLDLPHLRSAMLRDPVMGTLRIAYEAHKDTNETIATKGLEVQFAAIERYIKREAKLLKCADCDKQLLSTKDRNFCGGCRQVVYCSKNCQKAHWKTKHKAECKKVQLVEPW